MNQLVLFIITYIITFLIYNFIVLKKKKRNNKKPVEVRYLISKYNLDIKKMDYKKFLLNIALISSLDISIIVTLISMFGGLLLELFFIVLIVPIIIISYSLLGIYYQKKGMIKDE